jgi:hypothetical protein
MFRKLPLLVMCLVLANLSFANPMRPDPAAQTVKPAVTKTPTVVRAPRLPVLEGVVIIGDYRKAIFQGGQELRVGEQISGYTLSVIEAQFVQLKRGNAIRTLSIKTSGDFKITPTKED